MIPASQWRNRSENCGVGDRKEKWGVLVFAIFPIQQCNMRLSDMRVGNDGLTDDPIIYWYRDRIDYQDDTDENISGRMLPVQTV